MSDGRESGNSRGAAPHLAVGAASEVVAQQEDREMGRADNAQKRLKAPHFVSSEETPLDERAELWGLTPKQAEVLALLMVGTSVTRAAELSGVARATVYRWLEQCDGFQAMLNRGRREVQMTVRAQLEMLSQHAVSAVAQSLIAGNARTAMQLLRGLGFLPGKAAACGSSSPAQVAADRRDRQALNELLAALR